MPSCQYFGSFFILLENGLRNFSMIQGQAFESAGKPSWNGLKSLDFFECVLKHFHQPLVVGSCPDDGMNKAIYGQYYALELGLELYKSCLRDHKSP